MLTLVVPVRDGAALLPRTLPPLVATLPPGAELLVADDGSADGSADVAVSLRAQVLRHPTATGPAAARNRGAREARGDVLVFLDADVRVHADTVGRLVRALDEPDVAAAFGSYDDAPEERGVVSLYKNLAHHWVHQRSRTDASTFWAGCGAIRREAFLSLGGFDERYRRPSIEDVELGYRLRAAGHRIRLVPDAQVTHLKRWTLATWLASDVRDRAIPWAHLVRAGRGLPRDLNFTPRDRLASALVAGALAFAAGAAWHPRLLGASATLAGLALACDAGFLAFAARRVSVPFAAIAGALHLLHRVAGLVGFAVGFLTPGPAGPWAPAGTTIGSGAGPRR